MIRAVEWSNRFFVKSRWISSDYRSGVVRGLPAAGKARVMIDGPGEFVSLALVLEVSFLHPAPKWTDTRRIGAAYFNRIDGVALSDSLPDEPVLALDGVHIEPALAEPSCSDPAPSEPVRNAAGE